MYLGSARKISVAVILLLACLLAPPVLAAGFTGTWQTTIVDDDGKDIRTVFRIAEVGTWTAAYYAIDVDSAGYLAEGVAVDGDKIRFSIGPMRGTFEGTLSADGDSISGFWKQAKTPRPLVLRRATPATAWPLDLSPHTTQFVTTGDGVRLEVLDWGGTGRPLLFIPGFDDTAHVFDEFAPELAIEFHVYGITPRGRGNSARPEPVGDNYAAARLGDDVVDVIAALKLEKPVLVGHSFGGEELSAVAARHPENIAGLIYLDAGYSYAYYAPGLAQQPAPVLPPPQTLAERIDRAMRAGQQRFTSIDLPVLAIFATPRTNSQGQLSAAEFSARQRDESLRDAQIAAFAAGVKDARIVKLPDAGHILWQNNASRVVREIKIFANALPP